MRTAITIILRILVLLSLVFIIYCVWTISSFNTHRETDPLGAMVALYFLGFPSLIVIGLVLLIAKRPLRLSWTAGLIPTLYAMPYSLELILKEQRWGSVAYHTWWNTYAYPWTDTFFILTIAVLVLYAVLFAASLAKRKIEKPEPPASPRTRRP